MKTTFNEKGYNLMSTPFKELPLGSVRPMGWLKDQLQIQANGFTGKLPDYWDDLGPNSGWLGGTGESWERGPYYLDGLLPLAYLLNDETLIAKSREWIDWTLQSQREDGQFGPTDNDDWWSRMVMIKVLIQYYEVTQDERVIPFLTKYFQYQLRYIEERPLSDWAEARACENILVAQWLYSRTREGFLLELCEILHKQSIDWTDIFTHFPFWNYQTSFDHRVHIVNVLMGLKEPALYYLQSGEAIYKEAAWKGIQSLMLYHGQMNGMPSGDEWLAGTHPSQGVELCAVVEYMFTLENLVRIFGDGKYADILEKITFNALPATITADWHGRQYDQQVNQVICSHERRNWTENRDDSNLFALEPNFGCCTANMHQGWPKFSARLWMRTENEGLAAISYAPCHVETKVRGKHVKLNVSTNYPFEEHIAIDLNLEGTVHFPLKLRIPNWCNSHEILLNGQKLSYPEQDNGFIELVRDWNNGDQIQLKLPMNISIEQRANNAVGIQRGPLVYALQIKENWVKRYGREPFPSWEVLPESPWNYGLSIDKENLEGAFQVEKSAMTTQPFAYDAAPVALITKGRRIPQWKMEMNSAGTLPISPVKTLEPEEAIRLVPYGSARLRIGEFPVIKQQI